MSRFSSDYDDYDELAAGRWAWNVQQAIKGRKGQKALRDLREALLALPQKRLIAGEFATPDGEVCTVGALVAYKRAQTKGIPIPDAIAEVSAEDRRPWSNYTLNPENGRYERKLRSYDFDGNPTIWTIDRDEDQDDLATETVERGQEAGLVPPLAWELGWLNDEMWDNLTPEVRWRVCLKWVENHITVETAS